MCVVVWKDWNKNLLKDGEQESGLGEVVRRIALACGHGTSLFHTWDKNCLIHVVPGLKSQLNLEDGKIR